MVRRMENGGVFLVLGSGTCCHRDVLLESLVGSTGDMCF
jgi:hypothetical protein